MTEVPMPAMRMHGPIDMQYRRIRNLAAPSANNDATTKAWVAAQLAAFTVDELAALTMAGDITMGGNKITGLPTPTADSEPATKAWAEATFLSAISGEFTMTGDLIMDSNNISGLPSPAGNTEPVTLAYFNAHLPAGLTNYFFTVGAESWCNYVTDGTADDVQINQALDAAAASTSQRVVVLLPGVYDITGQITVHKYTSLLGARWPVNGYMSGDLAMTGFTTLSITYSAGSAIRLEHGGEIGNFATYYPNQTIHGHVIGDFIQYPATIILYSPDTAQPDDVKIHDINLMNAWIGIDAQAFHTNMWIERVVGFPLYRGILVDNETDPDHIYGVRFGFQYFPISQDADAEQLQSWVRNNAIAFYLVRADHVMLIRCYVFDYDVGYQFNHATQGNAFHLIGCSADFCRTSCIKINNWTMGVIEGGIFNACVNTTSGLDPNWNASAVCIEVLSTAGASATRDIVFSNCVILSDARAIRVVSSFKVKFNNCDIKDFNRVNAGSTSYGALFESALNCSFNDGAVNGTGAGAGTHSGGIGFDGNCHKCICALNEIASCPGQAIYFGMADGQCFGNLVDAASGAITVSTGSGITGDNKHL